MAASFLPSRGLAKRKSLRDQLDHILTLDDDERDRQRFETLDELVDDVEEAKDFRWHAPSTQNRQDYHLSLYRKFVFVLLKGLDENTLTEDEQLEMLFPSDTKQLAHQFSMFVTYAFKRAIPRSRASSSTIHVRTLVQYRDSMLHWAKWYFEKRGLDLPRRQIFNEMVRAMRYVQHKYGDPTLKKEKPWLGLAELRQLLDYEAVNNRCIELSEQHQALWCLGRLTALRPGSLCPSGRYGRTKPLTWRSFKFLVGDEPGRFEVRLTLDRLDIKRSADTLTQAEAPVDRPVPIRLPSPEPHNLVFSAAHRLLVIALRRGILANGISTIDDLFASDFVEIAIQPEHLDDIVFFAGTPKGEALDWNKAMQAAAMTEYLRLRGLKMGYSQSLSWYAIRRRAATDMARRIGLKATRMFLGHSKDSQTLERYYLNMMETLDTTNVLTEEGIEHGGVSSKMVAQFAPIALNKLDDPALQRTRGIALAHMTRRIILADPEGPEDETAAGLKQYRKRARRLAQQVLIQQESEWQRGKMTKADLDTRRAGLLASTFADAVLQRAFEAVEEHPDGQWGGEESEEQDVLDRPDDEDGSLFVGVDEEIVEEAEPDLEKTLESVLEKDLELDDTGAITLTIDDDVDPDDPRGQQVQNIEYAQLARSAMELLLDNSLSKHVLWSKQDQRCPLCQEDNTVPDDAKSKRYATAVKLEAHLEGHYHHPVSTWRRMAEREWVDENKQFACEYCKEAGVDPVETFKKSRDLLRHVVDSTQLSTNRRHDELKAADGWYDEEFANALDLGPSARSIEKYHNQGAKNLAEMGIDFTPKRQLMQPEPYEHSNAIVRGSHPKAPLPARLQPFVNVGTPQDFAANAIPAHLQDELMTGYMPTTTNPLPAYMRDDVVVTKLPRSQEGDQDEEMEY